MAGFAVPATWIAIPPAKRQDLTPSVIQAELGKPASFPGNPGISRLQSRPNGLRVKERRRKQMPPSNVADRPTSVMVLFYEKITVRLQ
ncbi:MAG: hypothetical protein WD431_23845 [Cyclobacteriaceae bacterium]